MDEKSLALLIDFIKAVGLPGAIAFYVLIRVDRTLHELVAAVKQLHLCVDKLTGKLG